MFKRFFHGFVLLAFAVGLVGIAPVTPAAAQADVGSVSPKGLLNPDGTLKLDGSFSGSLDLSGYNVTMDPQRGPVFGPARGGEADPLAPATNQWGKLSRSGAVFNSYITDIAVNGSDMYVVGDFQNAAGIPEADGVAKWDGANWSALGSDGTGDGAIWGRVSDVAVSGSNVYIGGQFTDVNNNGVSLTAADYIAKWDGANWSALGSNGAGNGSLNSYVYAIEVIGTDVFVGGNFTNVNNNGTTLATADYIAKWNGSAWSNLQTNNGTDGALNNAVFALENDGSGNLLVGGYFTDVHNGALTLTSADYIAKWGGLFWSSLGTGSGNGSLNNSVNTIAVIGTDVYAGGSFTNVNNSGTILTAADYVAKWDGSNWSALADNGNFDGSVVGSVYALAVNGGNLYVGGQFDDVNNKGVVRTAADRVARWNGTDWFAVGNNGAGNGVISSPDNSYVFVMAFSGSNLLVGGLFFDVNNGGTVVKEADYLAQWNGSDWSAVGSADTGSLSARVFAVAVSGTNVYVGGEFENVANNGVNIPEADHIAKWNGTSWSALGNNGSGDGSIGNTVYAITVSGSNVYVGGTFSNVQNSDGNYVVGGARIVKWDGSEWVGLGHGSGSNPSLNGGVYAIAVSGSNVYVGGTFTAVDNNGTVVNNADRIAKFNGTTWSALGDNGAGEGSLNGTVYAIAVSGSNVYAGGSFTDVNNNGSVLAEADYLAKWNGFNWSALGSDGSGDGALNSNVVALAISGPNLYAGGYFNNAANILEADYIAKWNGTAWSALGSNGAGNGVLTYPVFSIAVKGTNVYAGGGFSNIVNNNATINTADYVAKFNGTNWSALGSNGSGDGALSGWVRAVAVSGLNLYAGGDFTSLTNNGNLLEDAEYIAAHRLPPTTVVFKSSGAQDGWILETSESANTGGSINAVGTAFNLGDNAVRKQYRAVLSFNTKSLPNNAVITKVTLKVKRQGVTGGGNPLSAFQGFMVDIKKGFFGTTALQTGDFQSAANKTYGPFNPPLVTGWYALNLTPGKAYVNKLATGGGLTQIRMRFKLDDNNNGIANYLSLFSGNAPLASRPQLIIQYYIP